MGRIEGKTLRYVVQIHFATCDLVTITSDEPLDDQAAVDRALKHWMDDGEDVLDGCAHVTGTHVVFKGVVPRPREAM
jgi:spore coat polysaccharide biosynthesis protein SpsF (cytidylyltransferase family)